jgi:hypothetical protein
VKRLENFKIPPAKPGEVVPFCRFLNIKGNMEPCKEDPKKCVLGFMVKVTAGGDGVFPIDHLLNHEKVVKETLENCPKTKRRLK